MSILNHFHYTESEEKRMSDHVLTFIHFKKYDLLYSREGAEAGADAGAAGAA
jgi:hypothetical protein